MDWYKHFFDDEFGKYYLSKSRSNEGRAEREVDFLRSVCEGSPILDLGCGTGRHAIRLSVKTETVGLDLSRLLLRSAKKRMVLNTKLHLIRADMRYLPFRDSVFGSVINFFSTFGYFNDSGNRLVIREVHRVLSEKGIFVLEVTNGEKAIRNFVAKEIRLEGPTYDETRESTLDRKRKRMYTTFTYVDKKTRKAKSIEIAIRLYSEPELEDLVVSEHFEVLNVYSDVSREKFVQLSSKRILLVTRKKSTETLNS